MRAHLGSASQFCEVVVLKSETVPNGTTPGAHHPPVWNQSAIFTSPDLCGSSPESGDLCYKSGDAKMTICLVFAAVHEGQSRVQVPNRSGGRGGRARGRGEIDKERERGREREKKIERGRARKRDREGAGTPPPSSVSVYLSSLVR